MTSSEPASQSELLDDPSAPPPMHDGPDISPPDPVVALTPAQKRKAAQAKMVSVHGAFQERWADGVGRAKKMEAAIAALQSPEPETVTTAKADRLATFGTAYTTEQIPHTDVHTDHIKWALKTTWNHDALGKSYTSTPEPGDRRIQSWELERNEGEPLRSSDIFYFQYRHRHRTTGGTGPLPPLRLIRQQHSYSQSLQPVVDYLTGKIGVAEPHAYDGATLRPGYYPAGSEEYYALLGTQNGSGAAYLVIDWARELGITGLEGISTDANLYVYFHFTVAGERGGPTASSSTSSSTSTLSTSSTSASSSSSSGTPLE